MTVEDDLAGLLDHGERQTFHGDPAQAAATLERAVVLAQQLDRPDQLSAAGWLLGVALAAVGRFGAALSVLTPLAGSAAQDLGAQAGYAALAGTTIAGVHRHLGRHDTARAADLTALARTDEAGVVAFEALVGLAADSIGLADIPAAVGWLGQAEALTGGDAEPGWQQQIRLHGVRCELALLRADVAGAAEQAQQAVDRAEHAQAPVLLAQGLLLLGLAQLHGELPGPAAQTLRRAAEMAESLGAVPLIWPARALLGALAHGSQDSVRNLTAARAAVLSIAADLPPQVRADWLDRPDINALVAR